MPPCPAPTTCYCYLIRHAETDNNRARPRRLQGRRTDPALSSEGHVQARQTGDLLAKEPVAAVYSSPLLRARQTAEAVARPHELDVEIVDDLIEVDVGDWEGRAWDEIQRTDPEAYRLFMTDASIHPYLGGENMAVVQTRAIAAMGRLLAANLGRTIAAVAHNCVNRTYLAHPLGVSLTQYRSISQDNCGVNVLRYRNGKVKLVTLNSIAHLAVGSRR